MKLPFNIFFSKLFAEDAISREQMVLEDLGGKIRFNFYIPIFCATIIILWQFFASAFYFLKFSLLNVIVSSLLVAIIVSFLLLRKGNFFIITTRCRLIMSCLLIILSTFFFAIRVNWAYWDGGCPTYLLALVTQVVNGRFPVSFISFPEFAANYHQGFIFFAGIFSYLTHIIPNLSIVIVCILLFFIIVLLLQFLFLKISNSYYYLVIPLFTLVSSSSLPWFPEFGLYNYLSSFEYVVSNSWPLGLLILVVILWNWVAKKDKPSILQTVGLATIVLASSTANATVYSILFFSLIILIVVSIINDYLVKYEKVFNKNLAFEVLIYSLVLSVVYVLPWFIPSVFIKGEQYDIPHLVFRFGSFGDLSLSMGVVLYYIRLSGSIILWGVILAFMILKNYQQRLYRFFSLALLICFFFPIIFKIINVDIWDNIHKFAIINIFISIILIVFALPLFKDISVKKFFLAGIFISLLLSLPVDYDILFHRTSFDFAKNNVVAPKQFRDISEYLKRPYPNEIILIPFGGTDLCGQNDYGIISQYSGVFVRNNYFTNFLLSEKLEKDYNNQLLWWKDVKTFGDQLKKLRANEYIIFNNDQEKLFMKQIDKYNLFFPLGKINLVTSSIMEFTNFGLYH